MAFPAASAPGVTKKQFVKPGPMPGSNKEGPTTGSAGAFNQLKASLAKDTHSFVDDVLHQIKSLVTIVSHSTSESTLTIESLTHHVNTMNVAADGHSAPALGTKDGAAMNLASNDKNIPQVTAPNGQSKCVMDPHHQTIADVPTIPSSTVQGTPLGTKEGAPTGPPNETDAQNPATTKEGIAKKRFVRTASNLNSEDDSVINLNQIEAFIFCCQFCGQPVGVLNDMPRDLPHHEVNHLQFLKFEITTTASGHLKNLLHQDPTDSHLL